MRLLALFVAIGLASAGGVLVSTSNSVAQEPVIGIAAEGSMSTIPSGIRGRVRFGVKLWCNLAGTRPKIFHACTPDQRNPRATVTLTVTAATRKKYKLPSTTLATAQLASQEVSYVIEASKPMTKALWKIKPHQTIVVKVTVAFTFPIVETRTDTIAYTVAGLGRCVAWGVRTSNIDDGTSRCGV